MDTEPKYALEKLDLVLRAKGCKGDLSKLDRLTMAWSNPRAGKPGQFPPVATFRPDHGQLSIRQDHVVTIALVLGLDPDEVLRRLKRRGGELLEP